MRLTLLSGFLLVSVMTSSCAQIEFDQCVRAISYRHYELPNLIDALPETDEIPSSYVATKGVAMLGMYYIVVANYEERSIVTTYWTGIGIRSISITKEEGRDLFRLAASVTSQTPKARNRGAHDRNSCHFVRAGSGQEKSDGMYINPRSGKLRNDVSVVFDRIDSLLYQAYGEITYKSFTDAPPPPEYSEEELDELYEQTRRNLFSELDSAGFLNTAVIRQ